ncbi:MAG: hypothetical protein K0B14_19275, partial [Anaerolineaceae bacterium]|nr:hypothetical protein [Anaerolineaceae bacterium]
VLRSAQQKRTWIRCLGSPMVPTSRSPVKQQKGIPQGSLFLLALYMQKPHLETLIQLLPGISGGGSYG